MKNKISGIYKITNKVNGKFYIGSSIDIEDRCENHYYSHRKMLNRGEHYNNHLQNAWNKYGEENFIFEVIELYPSSIETKDKKNKTRLLILEQKYLDILTPWKKEIGYNISKNSSGGNLGDEVNKKISKASRIYRENNPNWHPLISKKARKKASESAKIRCANGIWESPMKNEESKRKSIEKRKKPVIQINPITNEKINRFDSATEAAESLGIKSGIYIGVVCNGFQKTSGGYKWCWG